MFYFVLAVGLVAILDLLLTLEILRRLRAGAQTDPGLDRMIAEGSSPAAFSATDTLGRPVEASDLRDCLIGFFGSGCRPCAELKPGFLKEAARGRCVAVVIDDGDDGTPELVAELESVARVVVEKPGGQVMAAFGVDGVPTVCRTDSAGRIAQGHRHLDPVLRRVGTV